MADPRGTYDHPTWRTACGVGVGYLLVLGLLFVLLFALPYIVFSAL